MAKQTIVKLLDDTDGGDAAETVAFAYDGVDYTIDLSAKNAAKLRKALGPFISAGTRSSRLIPRQRTGPMATLDGRTKIRAWARKNGYPDLYARGPIPADVIEKYLAARRGAQF